ncbi:isocitrate lyase/PEP mutase family protein [Actinomadura flavalba]|uniref:isocitrate lyase/PEP mutase family protein n=1 Tax=Actinomadura flavalba TaxID=1120938 RepID=UPI000527864A|nr:isocitrate lyase/phosphoenolpyruvate mutase family protein [Actinomadura flavalba]
MADFGEIFRGLHAGAGPLVLPNAWDFASAAAFVAAGFPAVGTTSLGVAAVAGKPDGAGVTEAETIGLAERLAALPVPVSVDAEGGFGDAPRVAARLAELGIAGINLEDWGGDAGLLDTSVFADRIAQVKRSAPGLFVNARTDAFWMDVPDPLPVALERVRAYAAAGADGVFVPKLAEPEHIEAIVRAVDVPLNVLFLPGRLTVAELGELGVRRVSMGSMPYRVALGAAVGAAQAVRDGGDVPAAPSYAEVAEMLSDA